jgi:hypothetical protein
MHFLITIGIHTSSIQSRIGRNTCEVAPSVTFIYLYKDEQSKRKFVENLEKKLGIKSEEEWNNVLWANLQKIKLPPTWRFSSISYNFLTFRMRDVTALVREVYQSTSIIPEKTASYKKTQTLLKSTLFELFPQEGNFILNFF